MSLLAAGADQPAVIVAGDEARPVDVDREVEDGAVVEGRRGGRRVGMERPQRAVADGDAEDVGIGVGEAGHAGLAVDLMDGPDPCARRGEARRAAQDSKPSRSAAASRSRPINTSLESRASPSAQGLPSPLSISMCTPLKMKRSGLPATDRMPLLLRMP